LGHKTEVDKSHAGEEGNFSEGATKKDKGGFVESG